MGGVIQVCQIAGSVCKTCHTVPVAAVLIGKVIQRSLCLRGTDEAAALAEGHLQIKAEVVVQRDQAVLQGAVAGGAVAGQYQLAVIVQRPLDLLDIIFHAEVALAALLQFNIAAAQIVNVIKGDPFIVGGENLLADVLAQIGVRLAAASALSTTFPTAAGRQCQCHDQRQQYRCQFFCRVHPRSSCSRLLLVRTAPYCNYNLVY